MMRTLGAPIYHSSLKHAHRQRDERRFCSGLAACLVVLRVFTASCEAGALCSESLR